MRSSVWRSAAAVGALVWSVCYSPLMAESITVGGTGTVDELLRRVRPAFAASAGIDINIIKSLSSSGGLSALAEGVLDVAIAGQLPSTTQKAAGLNVALTLNTPFVWATSQPNPPGFTMADLIEAYASTSKSWPDGTPVRIILRPKMSADTLLMEDLIPPLKLAMETARRRPDVPITAIDTENAELAERTPGSLIGITLLQAVSEKRKLRFVAVDGAEPSLENLDSGRYPYAKPLNFVLPARPKPAAERFIAFMESPQARDIFRQAHQD